MNNLKIFILIAFGLFATIAVNAQRDHSFKHNKHLADANLETVDSNVDSIAFSDFNVESIAFSDDYINSKQYNKWRKSTYFVKGIDAMEQATSFNSDDSDDDLDETVTYKNAITFFQKELQKHPGNGYAKCNIGVCKYNIASINLNKFTFDIFNSALEAIDEDYLTKLDENYQKKSEEKEKDVRDAITLLDQGMAMMPAADKKTRCAVLIKKYEMLDDISADYQELLNCLTQATSIHPCENSYMALISFLTENDEVSEETKVKYLKEAATVIPNNYHVKLYLAESEYNNKNYAKALELTNQLCEDYPNSTSSLKMLRYLIYIKLHNYKEALDDVITLANDEILDEPYDALAYIINQDKNNNLQLVLDAVREQELKKMVPVKVADETEETPINWPLIEAQIHDKIAHDYNKALECAQRSLKKNKQDGDSPDPDMLSYMGIMYYKLGSVDKALAALNEAAKKSGYYLGNKHIETMIEIESNCGMCDKVINDSQVLNAISSESNNYCYTMLGWAYSSKRDWNSAIKAYNQWIESNDSSIIAKIMLGRALILSGDDENGCELMQQILDNSDFTNNQELKLYTLYYLGRTTEARAIFDKLVASTHEVMNMTIEEKEEKEENEELPEVLELYNIACWYSLLGDSEKALQYLKLNFETDNDYSLCFDYAILDYDFDNVRDNPEFLNIINEYKTRWLNGEYKPVK